MTVLAAMSFYASAESFEWTNGKGNSDWNDTGNWNPAGVPGAGDTAVFSANAAISSGFTLESGTLTISVAANITLDFNGAITGPDDGDILLTSPVETGCGIINFNASSTFTGTLRIDYGEVHGRADDAFGVADDDEPSVYLRSQNKYCRLYHHGIRNLKRVYHSSDDGGAGYRITCYFIGNNTIGKYDSSGTVRLSIDGGKTCVTRGIYNKSIAIYNITANSELVIEGVPTEKISFYEEGGPGYVVLKCPGNILMSSYPLCVPIRCDVNGALAETTDLTIGSKYSGKIPNIDLNGTTQTVKRIQTSPVRNYYGTVKSETDGLLRINGDFNITNAMPFMGDVSLEVAVPSGRNFTLTGRSQTTGELIASSGKTVLASSALWNGAIRVAEGATFELEDLMSVGQSVTVQLNGGTFVLPSGTTIVKALYDAEGKPYPPGIYAATAGNGVTQIDGLAGEGSVMVVMSSSGTDATWLWNGKSGDGKFSTPGNWEDGGGNAATADVFDLLSADNVFCFPSEAEVTVDMPVYAKCLVFNGDEAGTVSFNASGEGAINFFDGGKVFVTNAVSVKKTVDFNAPVKFQGEVHMWFDEGNSVSFDGPVNTVGTSTIVKHGYGSWSITGDSNVINGDVVNSNGFLTVSGKDPLGGKGLLYSYQTDYDEKTRIVLSNAVVNRPITNEAQGDYKHSARALEAVRGTTNFINGKVTNVRGHLRIYTDAKSEIIYTGGIEPENLLILDGQNFTLHRFSGTPVDTTRTYYADGDNKCIGAMASAGNRFSAEMFICHTLRTEVDFALVPNEYFRLQKNYGRVDLWGTTQRVANAYVDVMSTNSAGKVTKITCEATAYAEEDGLCGGNIKSDRPGAYITFDGVTTYALTPTFGGSVSFERAGKGTNVFYRANTSTGEVVVTSGKLRFAAPGETWMYKGVSQTYLSNGGTWAGDGVTVTGGVLSAGHSAVFPKTARIRLGGGTLELDSGVVQPVYSLEFLVDGKWKRQKCGYWGAADNTWVPASNRTALITGSGVLKVLGDGWGLRMILK